MEPEDRFSSYVSGEGRTGIGQLVEFTCPPGTQEEVAQFLQRNIRTINIPITGQVEIAHGTYGQYTRYDIVQHDYAGGSSGYIEVLEIRNPPDGRSSIVINECTSHKGGVFTEWETLENARTAFREFWGGHGTEEGFPKLAGFKRRVVCGALRPWFYAIGDEQLIGDYAFPEGLQDDVMYRFGRQFVISDNDGVPAVKICMGTRFTQRKEQLPPYDDQQYRLVYWDDGSVWNESEYRGSPPRPVEEGELWITEAVQQFRQLLAGKSTEFTIKFTDGNKFVGKLVRANRSIPCAEGNYLLVVGFKGKEKPHEGWVHGFKPRSDAPDIIQFVTQKYAQKRFEVEYINIKQHTVKRGGKKWSGVFHRSSY